MDFHYNYLGKELYDNQEDIVAYPKRYYDKDNKLKWSPDKRGFDHKYIFESGKYTTKIILPKGKRLVRYGRKSGHLLADYGVDYRLLGLPYKKSSREYHEYVLLDDIEFEEVGYIEACFDSPGGVLQYFISEDIGALLDDNKIKEDDTWLKKKKK